MVKSKLKIRKTFQALCLSSAALSGLIGISAAVSPVAAAQVSLVFTEPETLVRNDEAERDMKITDSFTVATVGDLIQMTPVSNLRGKEIDYWLKVMQDADVTLANNENTVVDRMTHRGSIGHMEAPPSVADDWANMGIDMVNKANNHTFALGETGFWSNIGELKRVGIEWVGADYNQTEARMTRFISTPKGTVGLVGAYAKSTNGVRLYGLPAGDVVYVTDEQLQQLKAMRASILARRGEVDRPVKMPVDIEGEVLVFGVNFSSAEPGTPVQGDPEANSLLAKMKQSGHRQSEEIVSAINELHLTTYNGVTAEQMAQLRAIAGDTGTGDTLDAFGVKFKVAEQPGELYYDMNPQEYRDIMREVRTGAEFYDFQSVTIHWHQNRAAFQAYSFDHYPADYQIRFAHAAIDNGADLFFAHGVHTLKGVEIYKGKPIFYGISNFVWQPQTFRSWRDFGDQPPAELTGPIAGEGETNEVDWDWLEQPANMEALLTTSHYEGGKLAEVRIYPVTLGGKDRIGSRFGIPMKPSPEEAKRILEDVARYSEPFGTEIEIKKGIGIIRIR